jgi:hypothetical protein
MRQRSISSPAIFCASIWGLTIFVAGCDDVDNIQKQASTRQVTNAFTPGLDEGVSRETRPSPRAAAPSSIPAPTGIPAPGTMVPSSTPMIQPANPNAPATMQPGQENDPNLKKAGEPGTGKQGQDYGGGVLMAPITTPIREYFNARGIIVSDMIKHDTDVYHAINNRYPKDWEAFKKEILEPGNRDLPELPQGSHYVYDPKTGELFVASGGQQK